MDPHQAALIEAAARLGVEVVDRGGDLVEYRAGGRVATVLRGRVYPGLSAVTDHLCADKQLTRQALSEAGIPFAESCVFSDPDDPAIDAVWPLAATWVCKPVRGTEGEGVGLGIRSRFDLRAHWSRWRGRHQRFLLERQVPGVDVRIQALGGAIVAAVERRPASVVGDGLRSVRQLAAARDAEVRRLNPANRLHLDATSLRLLRDQGLAPEQVPDEGREVQLSDMANMSLGATAVDVTDALHPRWHDWIARAAGRLDLGIFALDAMSTDVAADPAECAFVLEVNARAQWLHHTFSEGRSHDMGALILRELLGL